MAVSERTSRIYVAPGPFAIGGSVGSPVAVLDGETHALLAPLSFEADAVIGDVAVHPTNGRLYVSLVNQNVVAVIDERTGQIVKRIPVQNQPLTMALDPPADRLYVAHHDSPALSTINTLTETADVPMIGPDLVATLPPSTSAGLAVDTQNGRIYHRVTLAGSGRSALHWLSREPGRIRETFAFTGGGSGLKSLSASVSTGASVANGSRLPTGQVGQQRFLATATDKVGNQAILNLPYAVRYGVKRLDKGKFKVPGNMAIKLQLQDAARKNQSSAAIPVFALGIVQVVGGAGVPLNQSFVHNPKLGGKGGGYELILSIDRLLKGAYRLLFTAGADGVEHEARFTLR